MLHDLAGVVEAEDVHARTLFSAPVQLTHMDERKVAVNRHALDLAGQAAGLFADGFFYLCACAHGTLLRPDEC